MDLAGNAVAGVLAAAAWARGGKAVHPHGVVHAAELVLDGAPAAPSGSALLSNAGTHAAIVRFSRSLGLPRPLPDLLGVSVRVPDAYGRGRPQDLMAVSSVDAPLLHHVFLPSGDVQQRPYSTALPYRAGDETFVIGVLPDPGSPRPDGDDEFDRLARAAATGGLRFAVGVAGLTGRFARVGELRVGARLSDELDALRFNPFNCGGGLEPVGAINRLRDYAYPRSQAAWARRATGAAEQRRAERALEAVTRPG